MIARGPAGYRFAVKALQHAVPDARVERGDIEDSGHAGRSVRGHAVGCPGTCEATGQPLDVAALVRVSLGARGSRRVAPRRAVEPAVVAILREARDCATDATAARQSGLMKR